MTDNPHYPQYRKRPVVIDAHRWNGDTQALDDWLIRFGPFDRWPTTLDGSDLLIETLEGTMRAGPGDWIIRGVQGEFYPCKPEIFAATYEPAPGMTDHAFAEGGYEGPCTHRCHA